MNKEMIRDICYLVIAVIVSIVAVNLFIWLLPFILIILLALWIYSHIRFCKMERQQERTNTKKKKIVIIDEENNN